MRRGPSSTAHERRLVEVGDLHVRAFPGLHAEGTNVVIRRHGRTDVPPLIVIKSFTADADVLWRWANDPETRQNSFNTSPILYEEHVAWLSPILATAAAYLAVRYRSQLEEWVGVRRTVRVFLTLAFATGLVAGALGAALNKVAPNAFAFQ